VDVSFLAAGFDAVRAEYGDLESYFRDGLNVGECERAELKARYLES
jgi:protein-tyrosine phosphatase